MGHGISDLLMLVRTGSTEFGLDPDGGVESETRHVEVIE
jgi:hypothetical protein